jgi:hypothetical protein
MLDRGTGLDDSKEMNKLMLDRETQGLTTARR